MAEPADKGYKIDHSRALLSRIKVMTDKVSRLDHFRRMQFLEAFKTILSKLKTDPLDWGEPVGTLRHRGLTLFHGVYSVLNVYYTVLEEQRTVVLKTIETVPSFSLESGTDENA